MSQPFQTETFMKTNAKERIMQFLKYKGIAQGKFEKMAGLSNGYISNLKSNPSPEKLMNILSAFPEINQTWLLTGEGEMLNGFNGDRAIEIECEEDYKKAIDAGLRLIPETSFTFAAGQTELVTQNESALRYWYLPDCKDCEGIASMQGNSMLPAYPPGCKLVLKRFSYDVDNPNSIPFGDVFGIVVEDKATGDYHGYVKILRRYRDFEMSKKYWIAHSVNTEFDDFDIEIAQVRSLWIVKQYIVSNILL